MASATNTCRERTHGGDSTGSHAEDAEEDRQAGRAEITPYWRVVRDDGRLNVKFRGGVEAQVRWLREEEGHIVENGKLVMTKPAMSAA